MNAPDWMDPVSTDKREDNERWKFAQQKEREFWLNLDEAEFLAQEVGYQGLTRHLLQYTRSYLGVTDDIKILQIGCAVEDAVMHFPYGKRFAIDPLAGFYIEHFERSHNPAVTYFTARGEAIPFATDIFDLVICNNVLDHVVNPQKVLREIRRVLRSDGLFYLSVDVYPRATYMQRVTREAAGEVVDPCHPHSYTNEMLSNTVEEIGFQVLYAEESASGKGDDSVRFELTMLNVKKACEQDDAGS